MTTRQDGTYPALKGRSGLVTADEALPAAETHPDAGRTPSPTNCYRRGTVKTHVSRIPAKLGLPDRSHAVSYAYHGGIA